MITTEIIQARPFHCGQIAHRLRTKHADTLLRAGLRPHQSLRSMFDASGFKRVLLINGKLAGIGGLTGSMMSSEGYIWLALSDSVELHSIAVARALKRQLDVVMDTKTKLYATVLKDDRKSVTMCYFLGFRHERDLDGSEMPGGLKAALMSRGRD